MQSMGSFSGGSGSYDLSSTAADSSAGYVQGGSVKFGSRNITYGTGGKSYMATITVIGIVAVIGWYLLKRK